MTDSFRILSEPALQFNYGQRLIDPRDGLALFGPYSASLAYHPKNISYAVIGAPEGLEAFGRFAEALVSPILPESEDANPRLWPPFPGFEAAFCSTWPLAPSWTRGLDRQALLTAAAHPEAHRRAGDVVQAYLRTIETAKKRDEPLGVIICVVPDVVWENCRPRSRVVEPVGSRLSAAQRAAARGGQADLFAEYDPTQYQFSPDFRRQLKARVMEHGVPIQIVRESTLRLHPGTGVESRTLTPLSDRAWNLCATLYYKAGGKPWKLASARDGVCYIGIAFRMAGSSAVGKTACCAAQMFLDSGDGIVFLGEFGPWYSPKDKEFHLSKRAARDLLCGVLRTYRELDGRPLKEVFLHSRSTISAEEFEGYREACGSEIKMVGIRVRVERGGTKVFRPGAWPVIRGTFWRLSDRAGYLFGSGFKPSAGTYDGWETPDPLRIDIEHGEADIDQVGEDVFGLTKLNYNACKLGDSEPVTIGFSDAVGEILVTNPTVAARKPNFKYYI